MSITVLSESTPIARKDHHCSACDFLIEYGSGYFNELSFSERRSVVKAKRNGWSIKKGEKYLKQNNVCDGEFYTFKAIPEIHEICISHNFYPDF